jgi:hypothetical protein
LPRILVLGMTVVLQGCALVLPQRHYVQVADAVSSPTLTEGIQVTPRMFTLNELQHACVDSQPVARLQVVPVELELRPNGRYQFNTLAVVAINESNQAVPGIPLMLEVEEAVPPVVEVRSDDPDIDAGLLRATRVGRFRLRIRTLCNLSRVETVIRARVIP